MPTSLRVLSADARGFGRDRAALAKLISDAGPHVVCVHGSPHLLRWRSISAALARRAGLVVVTGGRSAGANLLLCALGVDVVAVRDIRLAGGSPLHAPGAALTALRVRGSDFVLASATLVGNAAVRLAQAQELQQAIARLVPAELPAIISAEGSDGPGTAAWQSLIEDRVAIGGRVFVDRRLTVEQAGTLPGAPTFPPTVELTVSL